MLSTEAERNNARPQLEAASWRRAGISRSYAYALIAAGKFPRPVRIGNASRWPSSEIDAWIEARMAERAAPQRGGS